MWVQLESVQYIEVHGETRKFNPGDWVDVGKQTAQLWLSRGDACLPANMPMPINGGGSGALVLDGGQHARELLSPYIGLDVQGGTVPELRWDKNILWSAGECAGVIPARFGAGLALLDTWELAVPLYDYKTLALHVGNDDERERTKEVILDLRVPLYDTRLMFVRRTPDTERLMHVWAMEPGERRLAFLRALWQVKPFILALPSCWTGGEYAG